MLESFHSLEEQARERRKAFFFLAYLLGVILWGVSVFFAYQEAKEGYTLFQGAKLWAIVFLSWAVEIFAMVIAVFIFSFLGKLLSTVAVLTTNKKLRGDSFLSLLGFLLVFVVTAITLFYFFFTESDMLWTQRFLHSASIVAFTTAYLEDKWKK